MWKQKLRQWSRQHSTALVCGQEDTVRPRHSKASLKPEPVMRIHLREGMKARRHASISMGIVTKTCSVAGWWRREGVESPKFNNGVNVGKKTLRHWNLQARTTSSSIPQWNGSHDLRVLLKSPPGTPVRKWKPDAWVDVLSWFFFYFLLFIKGLLSLCKGILKLVLKGVTKRVIL